MDTSKASAVICLTLVAVIIVNLLIYFSFRRGFTLPEIDVLRKFATRSNQPWRREQEELDELSKLVEKLKQPQEQNEDESET
jgi:hypothetical protein